MLPKVDGGVSFWPEFRDNQEKGLVIFRVGGGGGGGTVALETVVTGLVLGVESAFEGDHGIEGSEDVMLLRESFFVGCFAISGTTGSSVFTVSLFFPCTSSSLAQPTFWLFAWGAVTKRYIVQSNLRQPL